MTHIPVGQYLVGALAGSSLPFTALSADAYLSARIFNRQFPDAPSAFEVPNPIASQAFGNRNNYNTLSFSLFPQADGSQLVTLIQSMLPHPPHIPEVMAGTGITVVLDARGYTISASGSAAPDITQIQSLLQHPPQIPEVIAGQNITSVRDARGYNISALMDIDNIKAMLSRQTPGLIPPPQPDITQIESFLPRVVAPGAGIPIEPDIIKITSNQRRIDTPSFFSQADLIAIASLLRHNPRIPEVQAGTNVTIAQNARGPVISASGGGGGSANTGTATVDFGAFPGKTDASVVITGQAAIVAGSIVQAWIRPVATADHSADEHMVESLKVFAADIIAGTGFTIYIFNTIQSYLNNPPVTEAMSRVSALLGPGQQGKQVYSQDAGSRIYGQWTVAWMWS